MPSVPTVYALHAALKELQEEIDHPDSIFSRSDARKKELTEVVQNCHSILQRLDNLLKKYTFDGTKSKRAWDRLRWGKENLPEIKEKIRSNTSALNLFLTTLSSGSLRRIETKLEQILEEVRAGKRKSTILAIAGDNQDEAELHWDMFERELVDDGFTKGELEGHKSWIKSKSMEFLLDETLQEEPLLENEGPGNSSPSSLSPEELKTSVPQPSNQPKICASGTQASLQTTFENVKDGIEKYYEAVLDRRKSEPKDSSGQELDCEEKSDLIPHSPKFVKSHSDEQSGDMSLPENPALNNGIIIKGISLVPYIHTPNPNSLITDQISYVENTAAKYQPSLGQFESIPVYPTSTEGTSHMSWYEVGGTCGASPPIRETFNEPGSPMPPTIFKNKVVEKPLLLTLEELFKGTNKKRKVKSRTNLQGTVYNIIVKPGQKRGDRFKFKNAGHQEVGGQQDLHFIIEEVSLFWLKIACILYFDRHLKGSSIFKLKLLI